jgi:hypothetical protein
MTMKTKLLLLTAALGLSLSNYSQIILGYDADGLSGTTASLAASTENSNLSSTAIIRTDVNGTSRTDAFSSSGWNTSDTFASSTDYISFTFQANSGYELSFDSIEYKMQSSSTAPNTGRWGYKIGTGSLTLQPTFTITDSTGGGDGSWTGLNVSGVTDVVEFRYWQFGSLQVDGDGAASSAGTSYIRNLSGDDVEITGTVTLIPEPSTLALFGLAALAAFGILRQRKK